MTAMGPHSRLSEVLAEPRARAILRRVLSDEAVERLPASMQDAALSIALLVSDVPHADMDNVVAELAQVPRPDPGHEQAISPDPGYEGLEVPRGSARLRLPDHAEVNDLVEIQLMGP